MYRRTNGWIYALIVLIAIGLFARLISNPRGLILPLAILGIIFYLYKFPPKWLLRLVYRQHPSVQRKQPPSKKYGLAKSSKKQATNRKRHKKVKLRVIDGKKKDWPPKRKTQ